MSNEPIIVQQMNSKSTDVNVLHLSGNNIETVSHPVNFTNAVNFSNFTFSGTMSNQLSHKLSINGKTFNNTEDVVVATGSYTLKITSNTDEDITDTITLNDTTPTGILKFTSSSVPINISGNADTATTAATATTATTATTANKLSTDAGSTKNFIYFSDGIPVASTETVGDSNTPIFLSNGVLTAASTVVSKNIISIYSGTDCAETIAATVADRYIMIGYIINSSLGKDFHIDRINPDDTTYIKFVASDATISSADIGKWTRQDTIIIKIVRE